MTLQQRTQPTEKFRLDNDGGEGVDLLAADEFSKLLLGRLALLLVDIEFTDDDLPK